MYRYDSTKPTLRFNTLSVEGSIGNLDKWRAAHDWLLRADLLSDWIGELTQEYERTLKEDR